VARPPTVTRLPRGPMVEAPKRVSIIEWDSLEQAQAFPVSAVYKNLAPQQSKAETFTRAYLVEAAN
jgi:uncharacterized protein (DUF1330 family)